MRDYGTSSQCVDERQQHNKRQLEAAVAQREVTHQLAGKNEWQMGGRRQRLHIERQWCNKNNMMSGYTTTNQGKQKGGKNVRVT
jgi:hypothetical protein